MRIAQVAPLWESVPPSGYGAIESLVADLTDRLIDRGHEVTLFASGDSKTNATLIPACPEALNSSSRIVEPEAYRLLQMTDVARHSDEFDVIHSHLHSNSGFLALAMLAASATPVVHTLHCYINPDNRRLLAAYPAERYVAISQAQERSAPGVAFTQVVHHGLPVSAFPYREVPDDPPYLAFLGRVRPEKGVHLAINAAQRAGIPLKIAGRVKPQDRDYFDDHVRPHLASEEVEYVGELNFGQKTALLGGAASCLVVSLIDEPFGLGTLEAAACGTPVVGLARGALPEIIAPGINGIVCDSPERLPEAIHAATTLDRARCRTHVAERFSLHRMVSAYESVYTEILRDTIPR